jgi:hypothetical protein
MSELYYVGQLVRLIPYHKDNRVTTIRAVGPESCVLEEPRGPSSGYYIWNYADIEPI